MEDTMRPTTATDDNVFDFQALPHPGTVFTHPKDVVSHPDLTLAEKRAILASWASDASAIASCPALRAPEGLLHALCELDGGPHNPPGGAPESQTREMQPAAPTWKESTATRAATVRTPA
jgi:hypothetical protein